MITDLYFYLLAIPSLLVFGISKGGFGGGLGIIAVPIISTYTSPVQAAAIMLPVLCIMDIVGLVLYWNKLNKQSVLFLLLLVPSALVGVALGWLLINYLSSDIILLLLGILSIVFTLNYFFTKKATKLLQILSSSKIVGGFWGIVSGITSTISHAGGPPISMYLLPLKLAPSAFVAITIYLFTFINYAKITPYYFLGIFTSESLWTSLVLSIVAPIGMLWGYWLQNKISIPLFYKVIHIILFFSGL